MIIHIVTSKSLIRSHHHIDYSLYKLIVYQYIINKCYNNLYMKDFNEQSSSSAGKLTVQYSSSIIT